MSYPSAGQAQPGVGTEWRANARGRSRRRNVARVLDRAMILFGVLFFGLFAVMPFVYMVSGSFKTLNEVLRGFPSIIPEQPTLTNYHYALFGNDLVQTSYPLNVRNSLSIAAMTVALVMVIALPAALVLARRQFWWTTLLSGWVRVAQVVSGIIVLIPTFLILRNLDLVDNLLGVSLAESIPLSAFAIWILTSFIREIPFALDEAAEIDGAGQWQRLLYIIIPLARPGIVGVTLLVFLGSWNDFLNPLILLSDPNKYTIMIGLNTYIGMGGQIEWGRLLCVCTMSCIPPALLIIFAERHIVRGLSAGAIKE
jgi:multiple sugar transport system permease protein